MFAAFSWHSTSPRALDVAKTMVAASATKRKSAADTASAVWLPDGVQLTWRVPCNYHAGHAWLTRLLGETPTVHGDTAE